MIFLETGHALHFRLDKTDVKPRLFRQCTPTEFIPKLSNGYICDLGEFAQNQIYLRYRMWVGLLKDSFEDRTKGFDFTHGKQITADVHCPESLSDSARFSQETLRDVYRDGKIKNTSGPFISRILSMTPKRHCAIISLGGALPRRSVRPTRD